MTLVPATGLERLIKSADRVRGLGEVFTPAATVQAMLDLLPAQMWSPHPAATFLEPACGDGNFLVAILDRKLTHVSAAAQADALDAGGAVEGLEFHGLEALASIYGVDISHDNVVGGTPGHEVGARSRMLAVFADWLQEVTGLLWDVASPVARSATWILERNIQVGNMLATTADGRPTGRDQLPLYEYVWTPESRLVTISTTTLGAVTQAAEESTSGIETLFGPPAPRETWAGAARQLFEAEAPGALRQPRQRR